MCQTGMRRARSDSPSRAPGPSRLDSLSRLTASPECSLGTSIRYMQVSKVKQLTITAHATVRDTDNDDMHC